MKLVHTTLALSLVLAGCASSQGLVGQAALEPQSVQERRVAALRDGERVNQGLDQQVSVCKAISITGSRNARRICHTREEWLAMRRNGEESVRTSHREGTRQGHGSAVWLGSGDAPSAVAVVGPGG